MMMVKEVNRSQRGQALIELALVLPLLLLLVLGAIEIANMVHSYLVLAHLAREGATMTSRGTPADDALEAVIDSSCPVISDGSPCPPANPNKWRIIYSRIGPDPDDSDNYLVLEQETRGSFSDLGKRICPDCGLGEFICPPSCSFSPSNLPAIGTIASERTFFAVEAFYDYSALTPLENFIGALTTTFYERAIFADLGLAEPIAAPPPPKVKPKPKPKPKKKLKKPKKKKPKKLKKPKKKKPKKKKPKPKPPPAPV